MQCHVTVMCMQCHVTVMCMQCHVTVMCMQCHVTVMCMQCHVTVMCMQCHVPVMCATMPCDCHVYPPCSSCAEFSAYLQEYIRSEDHRYHNLTMDASFLLIPLPPPPGFLPPQRPGCKWSTNVLFVPALTHSRELCTAYWPGVMCLTITLMSASRLMTTCGLRYNCFLTLSYDVINVM